MNKEVFDVYKKMTEVEKSELNFKFKDSPVGIKFLSFLNTTTNRNFKNREVVDFIYSNEKEKEYNVLENRYFKLRKKIYDELVAITSSQPASQANMLAEEEKKLFKAKSLALVENKESAYKQLIELEKECWQKNIFELLPTIIDLLIFLNQSFNQHEKNKPLYGRYEKAMDLLYDIQKVTLNARLIYELNFLKGLKNAQKQFSVLKDLALKNKEYPRFTMCYHHISLYYKLGSVDYYKEMQVISRHLSAYKKLYAQNPLMPLINYRANYVKYQHFHFSQSTMFYHFNRCEFEDALDSIKEVWDLVHSNDSIFRVYKTEALYSNMFTLQCMANKYEDAIHTTDLCISFLKENNQSVNLPFVYAQKARIYTDIYPNVARIKTDKSFLVDQLDDYIKKVKKENNSLYPYDQALIVRFRLHVIEKEFKKAQSLLNDSAVKSYLKANGMFDYYQELLDILIENSHEKWHQLLVFNKKLIQVKYKLKTPGEYLNISWLIHFSKNYKS